MKTISNPNTLPEHCRVAVIGAGPAGLAVATQLKKRGVENVVVLEREPTAGGVPRHCGHPPFGMREFYRCFSGPTYARKLAARARQAGVNMQLNTTVTTIGKNGALVLSTPQGLTKLNAEKVVISTGVRETPRSARLVSGQRPMGIMTTGALQSMVYLKGNIPFKRPVIVGTELVSFSALLTCRHCNIKPVAMVEQNHRISARTGSGMLAKALGVPIYLNRQILEILGRQRVTGVRINDPGGKIETLECDGIVFTGQFTPETTLIRMGHLEVDPLSGGPVVDQFGRCSDKNYFATGNVLHPVETAGWCWNEGVQTATYVYQSLRGRLDAMQRQIKIVSNNPDIHYVVPQVLSFSDTTTATDGMKYMQLRFDKPARGRLSVQIDANCVWSKSISTLPERRVLIPVPGSSSFKNSTVVEVSFTTFCQ